MKSEEIRKIKLHQRLTIKKHRQQTVNNLKRVKHLNKQQLKQRQAINDLDNILNKQRKSAKKRKRFKLTLWWQENFEAKSNLSRRALIAKAKRAKRQTETPDKLRKLRLLNKTYHHIGKKRKPLTTPIVKKKVKARKSQSIPQESLTKGKRKKSRWYTILAAVLIWLIVLSMALGGLGAGLLARKLLATKPKFNPNKIKAPDSSIIYDAYGNIVQEVGEYLRENVEYEDLPNCLIDSFLAVEDSRYFEHFGFDIPRFSKAALENLKTHDFSQGGSTFTMQLIKNSYFQIDAGEDSTIAKTSIERKAQEIVLAIEADYRLPKSEIFVDYLNRINFGNNVRGVEKAAQYYFGKSCRDLDLSESAFLAGIINSPNVLNPYNELIKNDPDSAYTDSEIHYLENGTERRNEVLNMMVRHGYITETEANAAKSIKLEFQLGGLTDQWTGRSEYYQGYVDVVIDEVIRKTGKNPYYTPMKIYTHLDPYMQKVLHDIQNNKTKINVKRGKMQTAITIMENANGALIAIGGGADTGGARQWNRATMSKMQPGSTIKPVLDYVLAFNTLGWSTAHTICDRPTAYYGGHYIPYNFNDKFKGDVTVEEALGNSLNTCAIHALYSVIQARGAEYVVNYLNEVGVPTTKEDFDVQYGIGGHNLALSPAQLSGMYGVIMNNGKYIEPHTVKSIEFYDEELEPYVTDTTGKQVVSPGSAYMVAELLRENVRHGYFVTHVNVRRNYPTFAKTGTTDWGNSGRKFGVPYGATKDTWLFAATDRYSNVIWNGFDRLEKGSYFTYDPNVKGQIASYLLNVEKKHFNFEPDYLKKPNDLTTIAHTQGIYPYVNDGGNYVRGYILKEFAHTTSIASVTIPDKVKALVGVNATLDDAFNLTINWQMSGPQPDGSMIAIQDISLKIDDEIKQYAKGRCFYTGGNWLDPEAIYHADIYLDGVLIQSIDTAERTAVINLADYATLVEPEPVTPDPETPHEPGGGEAEPSAPILAIKGKLEIKASDSLGAKLKTYTVTP